MATSPTLKNDLSTFGKRLRHAREEQELSRPGLSKLTDRALTSRVIDHLESGHTEATLSRAEILAEALSVEKHWLLFGECPGAAPGNDNEQPGVAPDFRNDSPDDEPVAAPEEAPKTENSGETGSVKPVVTDENRSEPVIERERQDEQERDPTRDYVDQMFDLLEAVDKFREDGFLKHQRKMPRLLEQLEATASFLEVDELIEIAFDRDIEVSEDETDSHACYTDAEIDELVARILDTAVIGTDLYDVDFDVLKAFARKNDVDQPMFFSWSGHGHLVPLVRPPYREKALLEALKQSKSLALSA